MAPTQHPSLSNRCAYCHKGLQTQAGVRRHIQQSDRCRRAWEASLSVPPLPAGTIHLSEARVSATEADSDVGPAESFSSIVTATTTSERSLRRPTVEDVPDEDDLTRWVQRYPDAAGSILKHGETTFERWRRESNAKGLSRWAPFANEKEWGLARWLAKNSGQNALDEFLKLPMIQDLDLSSTSKYTFFKDVDDLPVRMDWIYDDITVRGDAVDENGEPMVERLDLWRRDPVECIRELIGNPSFREVMKYAPERVYLDKAMQIREYSDMWTAEWWWDMQNSDELPSGATIAPVILASDKTKLSNFRGDQAAWPVYMSIGNIAKETRRQVSSHATILVGYIPVSKLECFTEANRSMGNYRLFHHCMRTILQPLIEAGTHGVDMVCADGLVRRIFPILAAYIADHPEQCLVVNVKENMCPRGLTPADARGDGTECLLRVVSDTLNILKRHARGENPPEVEEWGLRPIYEPFWKDLPHCDIYRCITPDILHQLHKGVFKDHLVQWCTKLVGEDEIDRRFKAMADVPGLRYFKRGISGISQWTGTEYKEMQKVFVALLAGAVSAEVLKVAQAVVDFIYYAQYQRHTTTTLAHLRHALKTFHDHKSVFQELGIREHFNIAKIHAMWHYLEAIEQRGTPDGYNTELPERLHIEYAKEAYRAGNRRDYIAHMATWLRRQEAFDDRTAYLAWLEATEQGEKQRVERPAEEPENQDISVESDAEEEEEEDVRFLPSAVTPLYRIAKRSPFPRSSIMHIHEAHKACQFIPALDSFVHKHFPRNSTLVTSIRTYSLYKQIKLARPVNLCVSSKARLDRIRATPVVPERERKRTIPAHFDTVLIIEDEAAFANRVKGTLSGLRVARVRVIFELPPEFGRHHHPLAYIEWYTPFQRIDANVHMYQVSPSTRNRRPNAEIVSIDRIYGQVHLVGKMGAQIDRSWTSGNVLDIAPSFYVNPYLSVDIFSSSGLYKH